MLFCCRLTRHCEVTVTRRAIFDVEEMRTTDGRTFCDCVDGRTFEWADGRTDGMKWARGHIFCAADDPITNNRLRQEGSEICHTIGSRRV